MSEELKPCPFCGNGKILQNSGDGYFVSCMKCGSRGSKKKYYETMSDAITAWNTRPAEDALTAEVKRLEIKAGRAESWLDSLSDVLQKIITVTSAENSKKLDPKETVKWINSQACYVIDVMNECITAGTDKNVSTNPTDNNVGSMAK